MIFISMAFGALNHPISRDVFLVGSFYSSLFFRIRNRNVSGYSKDGSAYKKFTWTLQPKITLPPPPDSSSVSVPDPVDTRLQQASR